LLRIDNSVGQTIDIITIENRFVIIDAVCNSDAFREDVWTAARIADN